MDFNTYALGEIYLALRAGLSVKGQQAADEALLQAANRTPEGDIFRLILGHQPLSQRPHLRAVK